MIFVRTCQIWQTAGGESEHVLPVSTNRNTWKPFMYMHIDPPAQPETTVLLQTHTNSTYSLILFPLLAAKGEGQLVGINIILVHIKYNLDPSSSRAQKLSPVAAPGSHSNHLLVPGHANTEDTDPHLLLSQSSLNRHTHTRV